MEPTDMTLPAGEYLIIDPCYIIEDGAPWRAMRENFSREATGEVVTDPRTGTRFAYSWTIAGDGTYVDQDGHLYGVDSGMLACLPLGMVDAVALMMLPQRDRSQDQSCCGRMVTFATPFLCVPCDAQGIIRFGYITIETGSRPDDEDC